MAASGGNQQRSRRPARFIEFFTTNIRKCNTRMAYARAVKLFFGCCENRGLGLDHIEPTTEAIGLNVVCLDN